MARQTFLHIGLPKSGTSYLQSVLVHNRAQLLERERLLFPGRTWEDQVRAVRDVREMPVPRRRRRLTAGAWQSLADEIGAWPGDAVVSMEWLCAARPEHIRRIVDSLAPSEVHVIATARDLSRMLPASWQEGVKNGRPGTWVDFLDAVAAVDAQDAGGRGGHFWALHDLDQILGRWVADVPPAATHVVTVPPSGTDPRELWTRFCEVLGIDGAPYAVEGLVANRSLSVETTEMMRRVVPVARAAGIKRDDYSRVVKHRLVDRRDSGRRGSRLIIPPEYRAWVQAEQQRQRAAVETAEVHVIGELDELTPPPDDRPGARPSEVSDEELLDEATVMLANAIAAMVRQERDFAKARRRLERRLARTRRENVRLRAHNQDLAARASVLGAVAWRLRTLGGRLRRRA